MPKFDFVGGLLTDEETDVLQLRRRGWRNADIAAELNSSDAQSSLIFPFFAQPQRELFYYLCKWLHTFGKKS